MNGVQVIQTAFTGARQAYNGTVADVNAQVAQSVPPGAAHNVGALMLHVLNSEDGSINQMLQGKAPIWQSGGWEQKVKAPFNMMMKPEGRGTKVDPALLQPYAQAVFAATDAYLKTLKDSDLDRVMDTPIGRMPLGAFLAATASHLANITGEISALKGVQGKKGYPF
jgi:hypothetical protein